MTIPLEPCPAGPSFCDASLEHVWYANDFSDTPRNGPRKHGGHVVLLQDAARIENHAVIAQVGRLIDVVGDKERSNLLFIEDVREFLAKAGARGGVERSERLVQEEDFGFENKGAGEACALRFSAGKRANRPIAKMRDAQAIKPGLDASCAFRSGHSAQPEAKFYVVAHCPPKQQRLLKHRRCPAVEFQQGHVLTKGLAPKRHRTGS